MSTDALFSRFYFDHPDFVDGTTEFHRLCAGVIPRHSRILEIGAGPKNVTSEFLSHIGPVVGLDVSPLVQQNSHLSAFHLFDGRKFPFASAAFDACVSDYVLEHVEDPLEHFREVQRVLQAGGVYCFRTPNLWHYVPLVSALSPQWLHVRLANSLLCLADEHPRFRTYYRANTRSAVLRICATVGLEVAECRLIEKEPSYARHGRALFYPMLMYERLVNSTPSLACFRSNILALSRKL